MEEQVLCHLGNLSPYKVPGTDEIPNVVWKSNACLVSTLLDSHFHGLAATEGLPRAMVRVAHLCVTEAREG